MDVGMDVEEIKEAVDAGKTVHWSNGGYRVIKDKLDQYLIVWDLGGPREHCIGLTHRDGVSLNGDPGDFYIASGSGGRK